MARECVYASAAPKCPQQEENEAWEERKGLYWPLEAHLIYAYCAYLCLPVGCLEQVVLERSAVTQGEKVNTIYKLLSRHCDRLCEHTCTYMHTHVHTYAHNAYMQTHILS